MPLEPVINNAPPVARQIFKCIQTVKVIDWDLRDRFWFSQTQIDGGAATLLICFPCSPERNATASGTEVELKCFASDVSLSLAGNFNAFALVVVGPERAVAATRDAVTRRCAVGLTLKLPAN